MMPEYNICPKCGMQFGLRLPECPRCKWPVPEEQRKRVEEMFVTKSPDAELRKRMKELVVTASPGVEGYRITKYIDLVSAEVVVGTGIFSEFSASFFDFFGGRIGAFEKKFAEAKEAALTKLRRAAIAQGANAVIGAKLDYENVGDRNLLMVVASGTAVVVEPLSAHSGEVED
jgi:uncharacterized protein YbjQ (UPF0145 family)